MILVSDLNYRSVLDFYLSVFDELLSVLREIRGMFLYYFSNHLLREPHDGVKKEDVDLIENYIHDIDVVKKHLSSSDNNICLDTECCYLKSMRMYLKTKVQDHIGDVISSSICGLKPSEWLETPLLPHSIVKLISRIVEDLLYRLANTFELELVVVKYDWWIRYQDTAVNEVIPRNPAEYIEKYESQLEYIYDVDLTSKLLVSNTVFDEIERKTIALSIDSVYETMEKDYVFFRERYYRDLERDAISIKRKPPGEDTKKLTEEEYPRIIGEFIGTYCLELGLETLRKTLEITKELQKIHMKVRELEEERRKQYLRR